MSLPVLCSIFAAQLLQENFQASLQKSISTLLMTLLSVCTALALWTYMQRERCLQLLFFNTTGELGCACSSSKVSTCCID